MACFKNKTKDQIAPAPVIGHLVPKRSVNNVPNGCETWRCAFAPNGTYFAWSCGNNLVTLVPWSSSCSALKHQNSIDENGQHISETVVTIDCEFLVRSVAFGMAKPQSSDDRSPEPFWRSLSVSKDLYLATGHANGKIRIWDVLSGRLLLELVDHQDMVSDLSFSPDGTLHLISASYDGTLKVWDLRNGGNTSTKTLKINTKPFYCCAWSPNAQTFVSVGMSKVAHLWDRKTYLVRLKLVGHLHDVVSCDFSPDGSLVATASWDTSVIIWDAQTGSRLKVFGHLFPPPHMIFPSGANGTWIRGVSFSPDGGHIATVADDGFVRFWDVLSDDDPESIGTIEEGLCCAFSPRGQALAVGTRNGTVKFFRSAMCVKPLLFSCRLVIRSIVDPEDIDKLFIPKCLIDFLLYKDGV